ncbi:MAG: CHRD domain-containing protein [Bryobacterales bacterium]|nr:CHRD domain-containing protein [Bryobacterales bacterium]
MRQFASCLTPLMLAAAATAQLAAQSAETHVFVADMRGANEVPAVTTASFGSAALFVHIVKDAQGRVASGSVDFNITGQFAEAYTVVGLHIHSGAAGVNGPVTVDSGITGNANLAVGAGRTLIQRTGHARPTAAAAVATLEGLLSNPNGYYVNLHTSTNPAGLFRGQLHRAERRTFITQLSGANEVPALEGNFSGIGTFHGYRALDSTGRYVTGGGLFIVNYNFGAAQRLQGLHIHRGAAGVNGPVVIDSGLTGNNAIETSANGAGSTSFMMAAPAESAAAVLALNDMWDSPAGFYMNLHTATNPGGMIRGQMRTAESVTMSVNMLPSNEVPAVTLDGNAPATVQVDALRNDAGAVTHALVAFSVNYRFPGEATFVGLHIHEGVAGANGPVRIDSAITGNTSVPTADGFGNVFRVFNAGTDAALAAVNGLLANPEGYYLNIHTTANPGGAVRAQLAAPNTTRPRVLDFISGVSDPSLRTAAPGGLMTIFGENLFKVPTALTGALSLPAAANGTSATIGGAPVRIMMMGETGGTPPQYMAVQVPFEAATGAQNLVVTNSNGAAEPFATNVAAVAPALYFDAMSGIALRPDLTLVRPNAPAVAGEVIALLATGLGQTSPELASGQLAGTTPLPAVPREVTCTMGGRDARVIAVTALPTYAGVYVVAITVPTGVTATSGAASTQIRTGGVASNNVLIPVR